MVPRAYPLRAGFSLSPHFVRRSNPSCALLAPNHDTTCRFPANTNLVIYKNFDKNKWCPEPESNQRHVDFQSTALPTELSGQVLNFILNCKWRRRRDLNPRAAKNTTYTLSRGTSSTDLSTSPRFKLFCESCDTYVKRINR